jgi:protein-tyrosine-phosphatase
MTQEKNGKKHILFVCTGNTCRSPMGEGYFRHLIKQSGRQDLTVSSAGTSASDGFPVSNGSLVTMRGYGIDISDLRSTTLTRELVEDADLIITMSRGHRLQIGRAMPYVLDKTHLLMEFDGQPDLDVNDPVGGDYELYSNCFKGMKQALDNLFLDIDKILKKQENSQ